MLSVFELHFNKHCGTHIQKQEHDRKAFLGWEAVQNESAGEEGALHEVEEREGGAAREQDHGGAAQARPHSLQ